MTIFYLDKTQISLIPASLHSCQVALRWQLALVSGDGLEDYKLLLITLDPHDAGTIFRAIAVVRRTPHSDHRAVEVLLVALHSYLVCSYDLH